jgi:hypothetical protein
MSCEFICDGCGWREAGVTGSDGRWRKPSDWYERSDKDGIQTACCRECIDKIADITGKTSLVGLF